MRRSAFVPLLALVFACSDDMLVEPPDEPSKDLMITAAAQSQRNSLFRDDFEDGDAQSWDLLGGPGWSVEADNGNYVLGSSTGEETNFAFVQHPGWYDFVFKSRVKFVGGNTYCELILRLDDRGRHYWVQIMDNHISLAKENPDWGYIFLGGRPMSFVQNVWYDFTIVVNHKMIIVNVNGSQVINVKDDYMWRRNGTVGFEVHDNTHVLFDDVFVSGSSAGN